MELIPVPITSDDQDVFNWLDAHLNLQSSAPYHALKYNIVAESMLAPVSDKTPDGQVHEKNVIITYPFNGGIAEFGYDLLMAHPDEALLEISKTLGVGIKQWEYYHKSSPVAPPILIDGHDISIKPFNPVPDKLGYLANAHDVYPVNYIWRDENGSYQKQEVGGWAFFTYYRWIKLATPAPQISINWPIEAHELKTEQTHTD